MNKAMATLKQLHISSTKQCENKAENDLKLHIIYMSTNLSYNYID